MTSGIVEIENEAVIGIADISTITDFVQAVVMEMAFNVCAIHTIGKLIRVEHI